MSVAYAHHDVQIRGYVHEVVIGCGTEIIPRHRCSYEKADTVFDPMHYLPLQEQKVGAFDQAVPLKGWDLLSEFATLHRLLDARMAKKGKREYVCACRSEAPKVGLVMPDLRRDAAADRYVQVLHLFETFEIGHLHDAVKQALDLGAIGYDAVKHLVLCALEKRPPRLDLDFYPYLPKAHQTSQLYEPDGGSGIMTDTPEVFANSSTGGRV